MKIKTEIYRGSDGHTWKITREGEDVLIEQAIEPLELIHNETYEKQQDQTKNNIALYEEYKIYDSSGSIKIISSIGNTISRKV